MSVPGAKNPAAGAGGGAGRYVQSGDFDNVNPHLERLIEPGHRRILEVGCGAAALGGRWKRSDPGRQVWGVELDPVAASIAATRIDRVIEVDLDSVERLPDDAPLFDLIVCGDVLEHLRDPGRLLRVLGANLSPRGELIACVPNVAHWSVIADLLRGRFDYADQGLLDRTHVHLFTPSTFRELAAANGLPVVTLEERITLPGQLTGALAEVAMAMFGDQTTVAGLRRDLDTYQAVFRIRPAVKGAPVKLVLVAPLGGSADTDRAINAYVSAFRAGEPVRLIVAVAVEDGNDTDSINRTVRRTEALLADHTVAEAEQPQTELFFHGTGRPLAEQLTAGCAHVALGPRSAETLPGAGRCGPSRLELLEAVRTTAGL
jgi:SAM-dependent methyltransferase